MVEITLNRVKDKGVKIHYMKLIYYTASELFFCQLGPSWSDPGLDPFRFQGWIRHADLNR